MLVSLLLATALHAACPVPVTSDALNAKMSEAENAYYSMQKPSFRQAREAAATSLTCLNEILKPDVVATYHRLMAFDAYLLKDHQEALQSLRAALALQPTFSLPDKVAPKGNKLHTLQEQARNTYGAGYEQIPVPVGKTLHIDGRRSNQRPVGRPSIFQLVGAEGAVEWSTYVRADAGPDDLAQLGLTVEQVVIGAAPPSEPTGPGNGTKRRGGALLVTAGASAVAAGVLYGLAYKWRRDFDDLNNTDIQKAGELEAERSRINTSVFISAGLGGAALGLGTVGVIVRW